MKLLFHGVGAYPEGHHFGPAEWTHQDLFVAKEGDLIFQTTKGTIRLQSGDALWIPPNLRFQGIVEAGRGLLWVTHFQENANRLRNFTSTFEAGVGVLRRACHSDLAGCLMERLHAMYQGDSQWQAGATVFFEALLAEMRRNQHFHAGTEDQWGRHMEKWAREHLGEGIGVRELAMEAGFSESHFRKYFLQKKGMTAGRFLHALRISEAKILLQQSTLNLKQVGARVGYSDTVAFHRAFSQACHMTPTAFRRQKSLVA